MLSVGTQAQRKNSRYVDYIDKYKDLAIEQMKEHKIPPVLRWHKDCLKVVPE